MLVNPQNLEFEFDSKALPIHEFSMIQGEQTKGGRLIKHACSEEEDASSCDESRSNDEETKSM